jgi:hypothetical protein
LYFWGNISMSAFFSSSVIMLIRCCTYLGISFTIDFRSVWDGFPRIAIYSSNWDPSDLPGNKGVRVMSSANMHPVANR